MSGPARKRTSFPVATSRDRSAGRELIKKFNSSSRIHVAHPQNVDKQGIASCTPRIMAVMQYQSERHIGDILKDRNIILKGADAATRQGFTQVPNFLLKSKNLTAGDKMTFAMLLSYAWQNDYCFPGQVRLGLDLGIHETNVRKHLKSLASQRPSDHQASRPGKDQYLRAKSQTEEVVSRS